MPSTRSHRPATKRRASTTRRTAGNRTRDAVPTSTSRSEPASAEPVESAPLVRAPLVPRPLLSEHQCLITGDTRYRAALRLRQCLWLRSQGLPTGLHRPVGRRDLAPVLLGSLLTPADAARGLNFVDAEVFAFVRRDLALREEGACRNVDRVLRNMLSSEALLYNCVAPLALNLDLASRVFRQLLPNLVDCVTGFTFETAPARRDPQNSANRAADRYLSDRSAFDLAVHIVGPDGGEGTVFMEVKLTEACQGPAAAHRPRYDEAIHEVGLHRDPEDPVLRSVALEQFKRLHVLSQLAVCHGVTPHAHFLVLYPRLNREVRRATQCYAATLLNPQGTAERVGFGTLTIEEFVTALDTAGAATQAAYLRERYLDLRPVLDLVLNPDVLLPEDIATVASCAPRPEAIADTVSLSGPGPAPENASSRRTGKPGTITAAALQPTV